MPTIAEAKQKLVQAGFEIYRTRGSTIHLADRVRENLLMDSNVYVRIHDDDVALGFVVRAQQSDYPHEKESALFARAYALGVSSGLDGYVELKRETKNILDPGDSSRIIDAWFEITFEKSNVLWASIEDEVRKALSISKVALEM